MSRVALKLTLTDEQIIRMLRSYRCAGRLGYTHFSISHHAGLYAVGPVHVDGAETGN